MRGTRGSTLVLSEQLFNIVERLRHAERCIEELRAACNVFCSGKDRVRAGVYLDRAQAISECQILEGEPYEKCPVCGDES